MISLKLRTLSLLIASGFSLCACVSLQSDAPPPAVYRLQPTQVDVFDNLNIRETTVLIVSEPSMPAGFSNNDIILHFDNGRRQDYYADALWASDLSDMIQQFIINDSRQAFPQLVVDSTRSGLSSDYKLAIDVLDFQPVYEADPSGQPMLKTRMRFVLSGGKQGSLLADIVLERKELATQNNLTEIASGLESQLDSILDEAYGILVAKIE